MITGIIQCPCFPLSFWSLLLLIFSSLLHPLRTSSMGLGAMLSSLASCLHSLNSIFDPVTAILPDSLLQSFFIVSLSTILCLCQSPSFSSIELFLIVFHYGHTGCSNSSGRLSSTFGKSSTQVWPHVLQAATPSFKMYFLIETEYTLLSVGKVWILISCGKKQDLFPMLEEVGGTKVALRIKKEFVFVQVLHDSSINTIFMYPYFCSTTWYFFRDM